MVFRDKGRPVFLPGAFFLLIGLPGCTLHHVHEEPPIAIVLGGDPATVEVEKADTARGGQRILVTVEHADFVDLETSGDVALTNQQGDPLDLCRRNSVVRADLSPGRKQSRALFTCNWVLSEPVWLRAGNDLMPVLGNGGLLVMGPRPWQLSAFVRAEMSVRVTGVSETRGVDLGANFGARGLLFSHLGLGGRADVLLDSLKGHGQFVTGPEIGYVHATWPCARCSVEGSLSYVLGYSQGFAQGPGVDARFGFRIARSGTNWHGVEGGVGYRQLIGPESGGSLMFTLSYSLQSALRWGFLPASVRAHPRQLAPEEVAVRAPEDTEAAEAPPR